MTEARERLNQIKLLTPEEMSAVAGGQAQAVAVVFETVVIVAQRVTPIIAGWYNTAQYNLADNAATQISNAANNIWTSTSNGLEAQYQSFSDGFNVWYNGFFPRYR